MLEALYDELERVLDLVTPKVVLCASTSAVGGGALAVAARRRGITSLVLQHGMLGADVIPIRADAMLMWGLTSEETMVGWGVPRSSLLTVGSPRHDAMRPSGNGRAREALLRALKRPERPTFVFFSQGHDVELHGETAIECVRWLERTAARHVKDLNIAVRLHPCENGTLYRDCRHLTVMSRAVDLATVLEGCDWFGSLCSTVLYDGLLYGKPAWQFHADGWPLLVDNWKTGLATRVATECEMSNMVRDMLSKGPAPRVDEALVARVFANHGRATQAVADVVESRLAFHVPVELGRRVHSLRGAD